ncbi:hypothetical protein BDQ17DRAFT_1259984, partial [Cyathus striatus]
PLLKVPSEIHHNSVIRSLIDNNPHLFKIVTPINVDVFKHYVSHHPNRHFTASICNGLRDGFWSQASHCPHYPLTVDALDQHPSQSNREQEFLQAQCEQEVALGHFSPSFGTDLLLEMYSMLIHAVPKAVKNLHMVTNHSCGEFSLNSMVQRDAIEGQSPLDSLKPLADCLLALCHKYGDQEPLVLFKSDVKSTHRPIPMAPEAQVKQIVTLPNGQHHVDQCNVFGGSPSSGLWTSVSSLSTWSCVFIKCIPDLFQYSDDMFRADLASNVAWYGPYRQSFPVHQTALLSFWDEIGFPHEQEKQLFGSSLTVIRFQVDTAQMSISMAPGKKEELIDPICQFIDSKHIRHPVNFQHLAGWVNWALNVFPLLKPGLCSVYLKIAGKSHPYECLYLNNDICTDLCWLITHLHVSHELLILEDILLSPSSVDTVLHVDVSLEGIGIWDSANHDGLHFIFPPCVPQQDIFVFEVFAVVCAIHLLIQCTSPTCTVIIYSNSENTVALFNSLRASNTKYNSLLKIAINEILCHEYRLHVLWIPGAENHVADGLSH